MICPECGSNRAFNNGHRTLSNGQQVQRFLCRECGYRYSEKNLSVNRGYTQKRQVCVVLQDAKNLDTATETKTVAGVIGKTKPLPPEAKGQLVKFSAYLEREGYSGKICYLSFLSTLARRGANLNDPENVKTQIARQKSWNDSSKVLAVYAYDAFCMMEGLTWKKPTYRQEEATIWLPESEADFDQLISYTHSPRLRAFLQALRETYADPSEILGLEWKDLKDDSISISKPCKGHRPGTKTVSPRCIALLRALPKLNDKRVFPTTYKNIYSSFRAFRKRAAKHLKNDQLLNITFKTFRHWAGTQIAYRTNGNGLLTIQKELRHKDIKSTMKYIHNIPDFKEIEYEIATATTDDEIKALGKAGFEKYDEANGIHYYRRIPRKTIGANPK